MANKAQEYAEKLFIEALETESDSKVLSFVSEQFKDTGTALACYIAQRLELIAVQIEAQEQLVGVKEAPRG